MRPVDLPQVQSVSTYLAGMEAMQEEKDTLNARWSQFLQNPSSALTINLFKQEKSCDPHMRDIRVHPHR
jgi:hypothetical protein